ncbi:hypothetical protein DSO57_1006294 [Entomophthora muscae]|uniref:Uncharacterized protein n=1 Tax=Entomophthora muscae TaxID=34485 RepID=A0ACC2SKT1_9FUNG|nr:hypothetical protein DSO57_1006294 [Entomophthora muscae]
MVLPSSWRDYKEGQDVPAGFVIYNNVLVPVEQYNTLKARKLLPTTTILTAPQPPEKSNLVFQCLCTAEIGTFAGLRRKNTSLCVVTVLFEQSCKGKIFKN